MFLVETDPITNNSLDDDEEEIAGEVPMLEEGVMMTDATSGVVRTEVRGYSDVCLVCVGIKVSRDHDERV